MYLDVA